MSRRKTGRPRRAYHGFPWSAAAKREAVAMAKHEPGMPDLSLRCIAEDLYGRGLARMDDGTKEGKPVDAATLRRMLRREGVRR